ncbi:hypothetical protein GMST_33730 [Geomonas silvestris]|uniref:Uncharacterized protein n=1 Tax=Geomonas silvestris TaxID=2740184 RepID=A0A6V8MM11_9BACT|nr:hypothetical protein [Geomonas silvestris]GFO61048.1 hypothetical protein GMST_33730 [Geomonas silvestris]
MLIFLLMLVKMAVWVVAFITGTRCGAKGMLLHAAGLSLFLTLVDKVSVASNLDLRAIGLTLALYALMSFILLPLAWKVRKTALTVVLNFFGALGAFAGVNFIMDFLRGFLFN